MLLVPMLLVPVLLVPRLGIDTDYTVTLCVERGSIALGRKVCIQLVPAAQLNKQYAFVLSSGLSKMLLRSALLNSIVNRWFSLTFITPSVLQTMHRAPCHCSRLSEFKIKQCSAYRRTSTIGSGHTCTTPQ